MKKTWMIILALGALLLLLLASCGENNADTKNPNKKPPSGASEVPTNEEQVLLDKYAAAAKALERYNETHSIPSYENGDVSVSGDEALGCWYRDIVAATCVDKWLGTEYTADATINWNREELLSRITVIEDVLLSEHRQRYDALGNKDGDSWNTYFTYDAYGRLVNTQSEFAERPSWFTLDGWMIERHVPGSDAYYTYDDAGNIYQIKMLEGHQKYFETIITSTYNENGLKIKDAAMDQNGKIVEYVYTYDTNNRLISTEYVRGLTRYKHTYSYDSFGYVIEEKLTWGSFRTEITEYIYNDKRTMCTIKCSAPDAEGDIYTTSVKLDEEGRVTEWTEVWESSSTVGEKIYGDYYIFNFYE